MDPYRTSVRRQPAPRAWKAELPTAIAILAVGLLGVAIGVVTASRAFEAGVGVAMTIFGAYATLRALRSRSR